MKAESKHIPNLGKFYQNSCAQTNRSAAEREGTVKNLTQTPVWIHVIICAGNRQVQLWCCHHLFTTPTILQGCRKMTVGLSCAMDLSIDPESGFWSLFFDNSGAQLSSKRMVSHLIMLLVTGRVITKQPKGMLASSEQGISKLGCYLGFQIWKTLGKHFLLVFHQVKAAAEILQNPIFRSRGVNRQRIKNNRKKDN